MGKHEDEKRPRKRTYACGMTVFALCIVATACGVTAIFFASQANVCLTPYSYDKHRTAAKTDQQTKWTSLTRDDSNRQSKFMGWYSAPSKISGSKTEWIKDNPMNCITECQMNCTAAYAEGAMLLRPASSGGCADCLRHCTHPWGKNIENCHKEVNCTYHSDKHKVIQNFCQPLAMCFQMCAGRGYKEIDKRAGQTTVKSGPIGWNKEATENPRKGTVWSTAGYASNDEVAWYGPTSKNTNLRCIRECEYDGKVAIIAGLVAMIVVWLAPLCLLIGSGTTEINSLLCIVLGMLFWTASLILGVDAFLLNMAREEGRGWAMLYWENMPTEYEIIGGVTTTGRLKVTLNWMMHIIFGFGLLANLFTILAYYDPQEIWNRPPPRPPPEVYIADPEPDDEDDKDKKPKPMAMQYYGEERAKEEEMMARGAAGLVGTGQNLFDVDIGLTWERHEHNNVQEVCIKEITPGGAADEACTSGANKPNVVQPGDVVLLIGNVQTDGEEDRTDMHNVYGKPYSDWKDMVRSQPAGTKIRFMFARHSEFMKYQFDIIRRNVGDTGPSGGSAMPGGSAPPSAMPGGSAPPQAHEGSGSNFGFQGNAGDDLATNDDEDWAQAGAPLQSAGQMRRRAI